MPLFSYAEDHGMNARGVNGKVSLHKEGDCFGEIPLK